ncbi:cell envelope biogenesis protein OmpA [Bacteroidota bacterium]|nr:cell envelope biogenesis protein OmpA [Bacteroidota bacterium]
MRRIFFLLSFTVFLSSCFLIQKIKDGETLYEEKKFTVAADKLKDEFDAEPEPTIKARKAFLIAECYRYSNQTIDAEHWYKTAQGLNYDAIATYDYAIMLKANGKYQDAIEQFNEYMQQNPFNDDAKKQLKSTQQALDWQKNPSPSAVKNVEPLNSAAFDYGTVLYKDGAIIFTSDRTDAAGTQTYGWTGEKFSDLFYSQPDGSGSYKTPQPLSAVINSKYNEGAVCFNKDFNEIFFTRCGTDNITNDYCKIFRSTLNELGEWNEPVAIPFYEDSTNVSQPFLSATGNELYFSSDTKEGFGGKDLFVVTRNIDGAWSEPQNLGPGINTTGDEVFPFIAADGKLYFSSNGQPGMGGLDIFSARKVGKQWMNPLNLRSPINSPADDFGLIFLPVPDEKKKDVRQMGMFTSSRPGGKGNDDIYSFELPRIKYYQLQVLVKEKTFENANDPNSTVTGTKFLSNAAVNVLDITVAGKTDSLNKYVTDAQGKITFVIQPEKLLKLTASKNDYFSRSENFSSLGFSSSDKDSLKETVTIVLDKIYKNVQITLSNIYYDYNKWNIRPDAALVLDTLVTLLNENPTVKVELGSHTDSRGYDNFNMNLSQKRAQSCVDYLAAHGIDKTRLTAKGYGETMILNKCVSGVQCTEEEHQKNRRTTFKVTGETMAIDSKEPKKIIVDPNRR